MAPLRSARLLVVACLPSLTASAAHACTVCDSANGRALRAGLFNGHFVHTLALVLAPAPVLAALVLLLHLGMPDLRLEPEPVPSVLTLPEPLA